MQPTWQTEDGSVRLYLADCLDVLPQLEAGSVDAVVTDPPYGVREDDWDDMDDQEFARFCMSWLSVVRSLSQSLVAFCTSDGPMRRLCEMIYPRVRQIVWHKPLGSQYNGASESRLWFSHEAILHCYNRAGWAKPKTLAVGNLIKSAREDAGLSRGAVDMVIRGRKTGLCYRWEEAACIPTPEQCRQLKAILSLNGEFETAIQAAVADKAAVAKKADVLSHRTIPDPCHPCEKPVELLDDLLDTAAAGSRLLLDPFMGSGTTGVACVRTGRRFLGIEKEERYFHIAVKRIEAELNRAPLFEPPPVVQRSMFEEPAA